MNGRTTKARHCRAFTAFAIAALLAALGCSDNPSLTPSGAPIVITTARALPTGSVGFDYHVAFAASADDLPITWSLVSGSLPTGLTLSTQGELYGAPSAAESRTFTVRATSGAQQQSADFDLMIVLPPMFITTASLATATLGASYSQFLDLQGGDGAVVWSLASGILPAGISLSASGILTGNASALGTSTFQVRAVRGALIAERSLSITVVAPVLAITTTTLPNAKVGDLYVAQLETTGGVGNNAWSLASGTLPRGLDLSLGGNVAGTPIAAGTSVFTASVASGTQHATRTLSLTVDPAGFPSTATVSMPGNLFVPLLVQIAVGGTVTWHFGADEHNAIFVPTAGAPADINIVSNVDISRTFLTVGLFRYDCTIHPGMSGVVEVKPPN